jgi:galactokinase
MTAEGIALATRGFEESERAWLRMDGADGDPEPLFVPGRIEVLGKHTDYAGGTTLTCSVERGICAIHAARRDNRIVIIDALRNDRIEFAAEPEMAIRSGHWSNYPMTAVKRIVRNFGPALRGFNLAFRNTLPTSAGLSSSSTLITSIAFVFAMVNDLSRHPDFRSAITTFEELSEYLGCIENGQSFGRLQGDRGVGTFGGSEDHAAMVCSTPGRIRHFAFGPVHLLRTLDVPAGHTFVVATSGVSAAKTGNAKDRYNRASFLVREILERWTAATGRQDKTLAAALASSPDASATIDALLARQPASDPQNDPLRRRLDHFRLENDRLIPVAVRALERGDLAEFGRVVDESQTGAEQLLGNQVPETIALTRLAREQGAAAASAFGAGFGGSAWALVRSESATDFTLRWQRRYREAVPRQISDQAVFFPTAAGPPVTPLGGFAALGFGR